MNLLETKDTKETVLYKRRTSYYKHQVSEHLQRRPQNYPLNVVMLFIYRLICVEKPKSKSQFEDNSIDGIMMLKSILNK